MKATTVFGVGLAAAVVGLTPVRAHAHPGAPWITPKQAQKQLLGTIVWKSYHDLPGDLGTRLTRALNRCLYGEQGIQNPQDCDEYTQLRMQATPFFQLVTARCTGVGASRRGTYIHFRCSASNRLGRTYVFVMHTVVPRSSIPPTSTASGICAVFLKRPPDASASLDLSRCYSIVTGLDDFHRVH
jgi:hypothetical protein